MDADIEAARNELIARALQKRETPFLLDLAKRARTVRRRLAKERHLLQALDGLLEHFSWLARQHEVTKDVVSDLLVRRIQANLEESIYLTLCGFWGQVGLVVRDLMEVTYLVKHFRHHPADEYIWLTDRAARKNKLNANALRQKEAARQGVDPKGLKDASDYAAHSELLHVAPDIRGLPSRDQRLDIARVEDLIAFQDFFSHVLDLSHELHMWRFGQFDVFNFPGLYMAVGAQNALWETINLLKAQG